MIVESDQMTLGPIFTAATIYFFEAMGGCFDGRSSRQPYQLSLFG